MTSAHLRGPGQARQGASPVATTQPRSPFDNRILTGRPDSVKDEARRRRVKTGRETPEEMAVPGGAAANKSSAKWRLGLYLGGNRGLDLAWFSPAQITATSCSDTVGGSVKRSLAMASLGHGKPIAKAFGLDAPTRPCSKQCDPVLNQAFDSLEQRGELIRCTALTLSGGKITKKIVPPWSEPNLHFAQVEC